MQNILVKDNKDHFPIDTEARARNALARVNQYSKSPPWWTGSLQELVNSVVRAVKKQYKGIEVSKESAKPGPAKKKASAENKLSNSEFYNILELLTKLRNDPEQSFVYDAAVKELTDKLNKGEDCRGMSIDQMEKLLNELGEI